MEANEERAGVDANFNEITEEERHRIIDEEFERLDTGQGVEEELMDAVRVWMLREYGHILTPRRPHPNSAIAPPLLMPGSYSRLRPLLGI